jgi:hypothetical protein
MLTCMIWKLWGLKQVKIVSGTPSYIREKKKEIWIKVANMNLTARNKISIRGHFYIFLYFIFCVLNSKMIFICVYWLVSVKSLMPDDNLTRYRMGKRHFSLEGKRIPEVTEFQVQFMFFTCNIFHVVKLF